MNRFFRGIILICGTFQIASGAEVTLPGRPDSALRVERLPLPSGAELITFFERLPEEPGVTNGPQELPLMAILKDTLNDDDPTNDRIRQVWVFTYSQPSVWQRIAGGMPFFYHRAGLDRGPGGKPPRPVMDLGEPSRGMWAGLAMTGVQSEVVNPVGALARLTTHSFFGNYGEYRSTHIWEAEDVMAPELSLSPSMDTDLTDEEVAAIEERMELVGHPLGGLVGDEFLSKDREKTRSLQTETRGHNWELLRQRAEESGLYLQPLTFGTLSASIAILWVAETDIAEGTGRKFDAQFLNIKNPFTDQRLRHWDGYSEYWNLDRDGAMVAEDSDEGRPVRMIPLAMYALDHPKTPLLLVDFRGSGHAPRREVGLKIAQDVSTGVFGLTGFADFGFLAAKSALLFVHTRHGGASNRAARRRAFVFVRHAIGVDTNMDPSLRKELLSRIEKVDVNPIERSWPQEIRDGQKQYEALAAYAEKTGLEKEIARSRGDEMKAAAHGKTARTFMAIASVGTLGLYRHHEKVDDQMMAQLAEQRRAAWLKRQPGSLPPGSDAVVATEKHGTPAVPVILLLPKAGMFE